MRISQEMPKGMLAKHAIARKSPDAIFATLNASTPCAPAMS
jgi:hypothetical protein